MEKSYNDKVWYQAKMRQKTQKEGAAGQAGAAPCPAALILPVGEMPGVCGRALLRGVERKEAAVWEVPVLPVLRT